MEERNELVAEEIIEKTTGRSGMGTGLAMLIGGGLTLAVIVGGKKLREVWLNRKAKKEQDVEEFDDYFDEEFDDSRETTE